MTRIELQPPRRPSSIRGSGLNTGLVRDLTIRPIYAEGETGAIVACDEPKLPTQDVTRPVIEILDRKEPLNVVGGGAHGHPVFGEGGARARLAAASQDNGRRESG